MIESERHTALHELAHVFGAVFLGPHFISHETGQSLHPSNVAVVEPDSSAYPKTVTKLKTPRVLALAREAYGCATMTGVPLEDVPLGKGAHWEARLLGPELMSYGSHAGEAYVSDLTLAFLEDTNQYIANYTRGGVIVPPPPVEYKEATSIVSFMQSSSAQIVDPPAPLTPGYPRWGRYAGCDFVQSGPAKWPKRYTCTANQEYACTPDNRASAVCMLNIDIREPSAFTCGAVNEFGSGSNTYWRATCPAGTNDNCQGGACGLPSMYQYFGTGPNAVAPANKDALFPNAAGSFAVTSSSVGGVSAPMDYVPVRVKYWNCAFKQGASQDSGNRTSEEGAAIDSSLFGKKDDMALFGGQEQCPECRCFESSLMEFTKGLNPKFPRYGLCYRANCFQPDYLQVGVRGIASSSVFWYKCPTAGGKIYITGFSGALHCPPASEFCAMETISGVKFPETDRFMEFVFWMCVIGGALIFAGVCMIAKVRQKAGLAGKVWCGIMHFDLDLRTGRDLDEVMEMFEEWEPAPYPSLALRVINGALMLVSASVGAAGAYLVSQQVIGLPMASPVLSIAFGLFMLGGLGYVSATSTGRGVSCTVLMYMFTANIVVLGTLYVIVTHAGDVSLDAYVDHHFDSLCKVFNDNDQQFCDKAAATPALRAEAVQDISDEMERNVAIFMGVVGGMLTLVISGSITAARIVDFDVLIASSFTVTNYAATFMGLGLAGGSIWFAVAYGSGNAAYSLAVTGGISGVWFAALGIVGLVGAFRLWQKRLVAHLVLSLITCVLSIASGIATLLNLSQLDGEVDKRDDEQLGRLMAQFGRTMTRDELKDALRNAVRMLGIAMCAIGLVCLLMAFLNFLFARIMRPFKAEVKAVRRALKEAGVAKEGEDDGSDDEQIALGGTNLMFIPSKIATAANDSARQLGLTAGVDKLSAAAKAGVRSVRSLSLSPKGDVASQDANPLAQSGSDDEDSTPAPAAAGAGATAPEAATPPAAPADTAAEAPAAPANAE